MSARSVLSGTTDRRTRSDSASDTLLEWVHGDEGRAAVRTGRSVRWTPSATTRARDCSTRPDVRAAWPGTATDHLERLARIRSLQQRGFTLATIARLVSGELDAADEALLGELSGWPSSPIEGGGSRATLPDSGKRDERAEATETPPSTLRAAGGAAMIDELVGAGFTLTELAERTGVPLALLKAIEAEGLLIPRHIRGVERYTDDDVAAAEAGLLMLEWGIPLSELLDLARRHHQATQAVAAEAVAMFSTYVRAPLRHGDPQVDTGGSGGSGGEPAPVDPVARLLQAFDELLPAVDSLVGHHFTRTLLQAALAHVDKVGSEDERKAIWNQLESTPMASDTGEDETVAAQVDETVAAHRTSLTRSSPS